VRSVRILLLSLLLAAPVLAQQAPVTVSLAPNGLTVGDPAWATITLRVPAGELVDEPRFPVWGKTWGEAEIVRKDEPVKVSERDGTAVWEQRLVLAAFKTGKVALPPVQIAVPLKRGTIRAATPAGLAMDVRSVIPQGEKDPKAKPPAGLRALPIGERFWWTVAVLSAACLLGAWLLMRQRRNAVSTPGAAPSLPPLEELVAELDRLRAEPSMIAVHTRLSLAVRRYLGRRLPFPAVESTTSEIQRQLLSRRMPGPLARQTVELLRACDLVKFARQEVGETLGRERAETARRIAGEFETHLAPREPEAMKATG
jgi:hypothetical protein